MVEIKNNALLVEVVEGRIHRYECDNTVGLGEVFDVLTKMRNFVIQRIVEAQEAEKKKQQEAQNDQPGA